MTFSDSDYDSEEDTFDTNALPIRLADVTSLALTSTNATGGTRLRIVFVVDISSSMKTKDVKTTTGDSARRVDAVMEGIEGFLEMQDRESNDLFSLVVFNDEAHSVWQDQIPLDAKHNLKNKRFHHFWDNPRYAADFLGGLTAVPCRPSQQLPLRVILLSDGRPHKWNDDAVGNFQDWMEDMSKDGPLELHTVGFGFHLQDFEVLQQLAQLGRGGFQLADLDAAKLRRAFTSVSQSITTTRIRSSGYAVPRERRKERAVRFGHPFPWRSGTRPGLNNTVIMPCSRRSYKWDAARADVTRVEEVPTCVRRRPKPHAHGNMRYVYAITDVMLNQNMISKESKYEEADEATELAFVASSCAAEYFVDRFLQHVHVDMTALPCYLYRAEEAAPESLRYFCAERHLPGVFVKWVGNHGFINRVDNASVLEALAHYSYQLSNRKLMLADLQGVYKDGKYWLTDPQLLSHDKRFGRADLGHEGMNSFLEQHSCNEHCRKLGITLGNSRPVPSSQTSPVAGRPGTLLGDRLKTEELFKNGSAIRKLVFVGECSFSFSHAAAKLVARQVHSAAWVASEINWPACGNAKDDLVQNLPGLRRLGVNSCVMDAHYPSWTGEPVRPDGAIWAMPYPREFEPGCSVVTQASKTQMQNLIFAYVKAILPKLAPGGTASVVLMSKQHLDWGLRTPISTSIGTANPEMRVFSLQPLIDHGYRPRFGDSRDVLRQAHYHLLSEAVCVQWRVAATSAGMSDTRLRSRIGR
eukprot:TRINITY_DN58383_c0_g1_i1.p1 TRINITY_DN58383_c0_g1~~TRINITY_DN58383_c0_g1_i1.p1  ORF type:complete len:751 (-),score=71.20 TRINITY_DN58383_c0_g1_i1:357-2609(-)